MNDLNLLFHSMFLAAALFIAYCLYLECMALFGSGKVKKQSLRAYPEKVRERNAPAYPSRLSHRPVPSYSIDVREKIHTR